MSITKKEKEDLEIGVHKDIRKEQAREKDPLDIALEKAVEKVLQDISKDIRVIAGKGFITLSGTAYSHESKSTINEAVKAVPGVKEVTNHIRVVSEED